MRAIISGLAVRTAARGKSRFERTLKAPECLRGLEVVDSLGASLRQLGGDDGVRNTRNPPRRWFVWRNQNWLGVRDDFRNWLIRAA